MTLGEFMPYEIMLNFSFHKSLMQFPIQRLLNRTTWLKIHLYLALIGGFFFALMGLTGSISVYREELDALLNPQLVIEEPQGAYQSLDKIMASVQAAHPTRNGSWTLEMPRSPHGMITAWYDKPHRDLLRALCAADGIGKPLHRRGRCQPLLGADSGHLAA